MDIHTGKDTLEAHSTRANNIVSGFTAADQHATDGSRLTSDAWREAAAKESIGDEEQHGTKKGLRCEKIIELSPIDTLASTNIDSQTSPCDTSVREKKQRRPWKTSLIRFGPLSGIFCMLLAMASIVASLGILAGSDEQSVEIWTSPPSTYLAVCTAAANLAMRYAAIQGVVIAWWYRALKGTTLAKLHATWRAGTSFRGALAAGSTLGFVGLACIFSTLVVLDGPLLQRSSTVVLAPYSDRGIPLEVRIAPELPRDMTGIWIEAPTPFQPSFNDTVPTTHGAASNLITAYSSVTVASNVQGPWIRNEPLQGVVLGCQGKCRANIQAPALFRKNCTSHTTNIEYYAPWNHVHNYWIAPPLNQQTFLVATNLVLLEKEVINLVTGYSTSENCTGSLKYTICTLEHGIGEYDALVEGNSTVLQNPASPKLVAYANNTAVSNVPDPTHEGKLSTLAGIVLTFAESLFGYIYQHGTGVNSTNSAAVGNPQAQRYGTPIAPTSDRNSPAACSSYLDPQEDALANLNRLMVFSGAFFATDPWPALQKARGGYDPGIHPNTTTVGYQNGQHSVYRTNYWWFLAAALVELACIGLVAPTYWGWWTIGRPVSFSPLETAKALNAPLLSEYDSNLTGRGLEKATGTIHVKYGASPATVDQDASTLGFAHPATTVRPENGKRY